MANKKITASKLQAERIQTRAATDSQYIEDLADRMKAGDEFPPIIVVTDGSTSWLADGIHRLDAAIKAKQAIKVEYVDGNRAKAVEIACGANRSHGLRRTNADKRRSVCMALGEFGRRSDRAIAEICGVSNDFVGKIRKSTEVSSDDTSGSSRTGKDGKSYPAKAAKPRAGSNCA